ncbi:MAG TPA: TonB-dependent receptor [Caulobacteraceae bacterium]|jgi:outer membrane receptor protein involved in Fe transport
MPVDQAPAVAPVVVTGAQLPPAAGDPAFSIVTVDPPVLKISDRLDDALESVPGVSLFRRNSSLGANPTTQGISLRSIAGSAASRALVTLDGVPQNDPFGGWVIWTGLPPETLSSATVVRGAGAGPYGAGALTGVVALQQTGAVDGGTLADIEGGELGYVRAAAVSELDEGGGRLFLDASGEHDDGWIPVRQGRGPVDRPLSLSDFSLGERWVADLGGAVLTERLAGYQESRGAGTLFAGSDAMGAQGSLSLVRQPAPGAAGWRVAAWVSGSDLENSSASVSLDRRTATLADAQFATPAIGAGFNAAIRRMEADYSWEVGVDARNFAGASHDQLYNAGAPTGARTGGGAEAIAGLYAEGSRMLGRWLLTGGVRVDGWASYDSSLVQTGSGALDQRQPDRGGAVPTGRVGLRRDLVAGLYLRAAAYSGFRPATLNELHRMFRVGNDVTEANAGLSPERLYGAEAGLGGQGRLTWDADVFANRLADAVTNVTIGKGPGSFPLAGFVPAGGTLFQRQNAGTVNAYGVEADGDLRVSAGLSLRAAATFTHARVDGGDQAPQLTGLRPAETPQLVVTADAVWQPLAALSLTGQLRYQSAEFDDDQNTRLIEGGTEVDARAEWRLSHQLSAYVAADNLFDAALQAGRSAAGVVTYAAPRMVRVGLAWRR